MTIKTYYDPALAKEHLQISPDLDAELTNAAGAYSYWNELLAQAEYQLERLEYKLELLEATVAEDARKAAAASGAKTTEAQIKEGIIRNPTIVQCKILIAEAKREVTLLKGHSYAMVQRKDALLQLARRRTEEMKGSPVVPGYRGGMSRGDMEESMRRGFYEQD